MEIEKLSRRGRVADVESVAVQCLKVFQESSLGADAACVKIFATVQEKTTALTEAIMRMKPTSILHEKDEVRKEAVISYHYINRGHAYAIDATEKANGQMVMQVFDNYGNRLYRGSYADKTSALEAFLDDMNKPELLAALATLAGGPESFQAIVDAHTDFIATQVQFRTDTSIIDESEWACNIKDELTDVLNKQMVNFFDSAIEWDADTYLATARILNEVIEATNVIINKRFNNGNDPEEEITDETI